MKNPAAETAGLQKLNICFQCHSRSRPRIVGDQSGILLTARDRKKDSGQILDKARTRARMTEIKNCGRDRRV
ncbi:MAG: hypothetical protein A2Y97_05380 [Nitrospirae bacterium RBG_13_39_12]|nr:MAG: hypothetical protein A2Y97_05380 [Nitrospirae bacterium RBG_13_39_12]